MMQSWHHTDTLCGKIQESFPINHSKIIPPFDAA